MRRLIYEILKDEIYFFISFFQLQYLFGIAHGKVSLPFRVISCHYPDVINDPCYHLLQYST
jgi:hypothetical protein